MKVDSKNPCTNVQTHTKRHRHRYTSPPYVMNCSIFAPYPLPSELIRLGRESEESRESQEGEIEEASTETVVSVVSRSR